MRLRAVGCAGSFPTPRSPASCYLLEVDDDDRTWRIVLDLGNGSFGQLQRWCAADEIDFLALSHLHPDHVSDISVLSVARRYHPRLSVGPLAVGGPEGTVERIGELSGSSLSAHDAFEVHTWQDRKSITVGPVTITPYAVAHPVPAFGFRITGPGEGPNPQQMVVAYSGDTDYCEGLLTLAQEADFFLVEASFLENLDVAAGVHLSGARAGQAASDAAAKRVVLTHLVNWHDPQDVLHEAQRTYSGPLELVRQGAQYLI